MSDRSPLVIVGAGGFGREVAALVEAINDHDDTWSLVGFVDDDQTLQESSFLGYPVVGDVKWLARQENVFFAIAIGNTQSRRQIAQVLESSPVRPATLVHPSVSVHQSAEVGPGTIICEGVTPTVDLSIGAHVILNLQCTLGHDSIIGSFSTLHPGVHVSGSAHLATGVLMGTGSVVLPEVQINANCTVGAGAVVTKDIAPNQTVVGVPARTL